MTSKKILITGMPNPISRDVLFQQTCILFPMSILWRIDKLPYLLTDVDETLYLASYNQDSAVHWAEEGYKVLYMKKTKFESIPSTGHGPQIPSSEVLSKIRILYLMEDVTLNMNEGYIESLNETLKIIIDILTFRDNVPRVILVEELEEYQSQDGRESDHQLARVCATLCFTTGVCASQCALSTYLLVNLAVPLDKVAPVIASMFDCVWTFDFDSCALTKTFPLNEYPKVQLSLGQRNGDRAFVLKRTSNLFVN